LANAEKNLLERKRAYPFNSQNVINAQIEVESLRDGLERLYKLQKELF
jgi:hypothetical protein